LRTHLRRPSPNNLWAHRHRWDQLQSLPGDLNRKFEHSLHCREVCSLNLDKWSKVGCVNICLELREKANKDLTFISRIVTGDGSWIYGYDPETGQRSLQWKSPQSPRAKKVRQVWGSTKSMFIGPPPPPNVKVIVHCEFVPLTCWSTLTITRTVDVLRHLRENGQRERPELWHNHNWLLHHDNAPAHMSLKTRVCD
jgi:hypothetical protein